MSDFNFYLPITKVDPEQRMVYGYASTPERDSQGQIVTVEAIEKALPDYMKFGNIREMHQPSAVGKTKTATISEKGLYIGAKIVDEVAWSKVKEGVYNGFSIGGYANVTKGDQITDLDLVEISIVDRPANPASLFDVWKAAGPKTHVALSMTPWHTYYLPVLSIHQVSNTMHKNDDTPEVSTPAVEEPKVEAPAAEEPATPTPEVPVAPAAADVPAPEPAVETPAAPEPPQPTNEPEKVTVEAMAKAVASEIAKAIAPLAKEVSELKGQLQKPTIKVKAPYVTVAKGDEKLDEPEPETPVAQLEKLSKRQVELKKLRATMSVDAYGRQYGEEAQNLVTEVAKLKFALKLS